MRILKEGERWASKALKKKFKKSDKKWSVSKRKLKNANHGHINQEELRKPNKGKKKK